MIEAPSFDSPVGKAKREKEKEIERERKRERERGKAGEVRRTIRREDEENATGACTGKTTKSFSVNSGKSNKFVK